MIHAPLFRFSELLPSLTPSGVAEWRRHFLSVPCTFVRVDGEDARYAAALNFRQRAQGKADAVTHTARQMCYSVYGCKQQKENNFWTTVS